MKHRLILFTLITFLFSLQAKAYAQAPEENITRQFSDSLYKEIKERAAYEDCYKHKTPTKIKDPVSEFIMKVLGAIFGNRIAAFIFQLIPYILVLLAVGLIVFKFYQLDPRILFRKNKHLKGEVLNAESEDIYKIDIDTLLADALREKHYRLAVRFSYLKVLRLLSDRDLIKWKLHKSNIDYQMELRGNTFHEDFKLSTRYFDFIWYGNQLPEEVNQEDMLKHFNAFILTIQKGEGTNA